MATANYPLDLTGQQVEAALTRSAPGGAIDQAISSLSTSVSEAAQAASGAAAAAAQKAALLHASQHGASGSDPVTPAAIGAVSKAGDTMTGNLTVSGASYPKIYIKETGGGSTGMIQQGNDVMQNICTPQGNTNNSRQIAIYGKSRTASVKDAVRFIETVDGVSAYYPILHTGNLADYVSSRAAVVEYTGTGTNSVSVTVGFVPKLVIVQEVSTSDSPGTLPLLLIGAGVSIGLHRGSYNSDLDWFSITVTAFGNTVSWSSSDYTTANNKNNTPYRVVAMG